MHSGRHSMLLSPKRMILPTEPQVRLPAGIYPSQPYLDFFSLLFSLLNKKLSKLQGLCADLNPRKESRDILGILCILLTKLFKSLYLEKANIAVIIAL
jgi:hypothetical protein